MVTSHKNAFKEETPGGVRIRSEVERANAKLRHFRGIAASVMSDAKRLINEMIEECREEERDAMWILEGKEIRQPEIPTCGWQEFREKLNMLEHYIDYAKRLCEGSTESMLKTDEKEGRS